MHHAKRPKNILAVAGVKEALHWRNESLPRERIDTKWIWVSANSPSTSSSSSGVRHSAGSINKPCSSAAIVTLTITSRHRISRTRSVWKSQLYCVIFLLTDLYHILKSSYLREWFLKMGLRSIYIYKVSTAIFRPQNMYFHIESSYFFGINHPEVKRKKMVPISREFKFPSVRRRENLCTACDREFHGS